MSKRPSRGVSSGVGSPTRMAGRDGDLTIRKTKEGKILYVKEHGKWHPINTGVDVAQMKKDVDRLIRSVNTLRNDNNPYPTINALNIRKNVATATVDPKITFTIAGTDKYSIGVDDSSASDDFVISASGAIGSLDRFVMTSGGDIDTTGDMDIGVSKAYSINGTSVLNLTTLGSGVVNSSLTSVGTLTTLTAGKTILTPSITDSIGAQSRIAGLEINPTLDYGGPHSGTNTYTGIQYTQTETDVAGFDGGVNYMDMRSIYTVGSASYNNDPTITHASSSVIRKNDLVSGLGIPDGAYVASITDSTHFELSASTTGGAKSSQTLTFTSSRLKVKNDFGGTKGSPYGTAADTKYLMIKEDTGELQYRTAGDIKSDSATASFTGTFSQMTVDTDTSGNSAEDKTSMHVDLDRTVATSGTAVHNDIGIDLDVNSASLGTSTLKGMDVDVVGATSGTSTATGIEIDVDGADTNIGLLINTAGTHIKLEPNADTGDAATISVADTGDLTIATNDNAATAADIILDADGDIELNADGGDITFKDNTTALGEFDSSGNFDVLGELSMTPSAGEKCTLSTALNTGILTVSTGATTSTLAHIILDAGGDIVLDSGTGSFISKVAGTEFSSADSAYAGMILGMTIDGVDEADQSYDLTDSFVVPDANKFRFEFITPPSELVEVSCTVSFAASTYSQDLFLSISNHGTYGSNSLSHPNQYETAIWNPPARGTITQVTAKWIVGSGNLEAIGSNNILYVAAKTDNDTGGPKLHWGGNATEEYPPLIIKVTALPLAASISYNP